MDGQTDRLTDCRTDGRTQKDRQTGRQTDSKTDRQIERQTDRKASQEQYPPSTFSKLEIFVNFLNLHSWGFSPWRVIRVIHLVDK